MSSPSSNNGDNDAWLMKIELKREEPMEINKDESSGQVSQTSLGMRPLFENKPTSKVQIVYAASYVLESLLVQALILARSTSD